MSDLIFGCFGLVLLPFILVALVALFPAIALLAFMGLLMQIFGGTR